jgi:hypothetical protein
VAALPLPTAGLPILGRAAVAGFGLPAYPHRQAGSGTLRRTSCAAGGEPGGVSPRVPAVGNPAPNFVCCGGRAGRRQPPGSYRRNPAPNFVCCGGRAGRRQPPGSYRRDPCAELRVLQGASRAALAPGFLPSGPPRRTSCAAGGEPGGVSPRVPAVGTPRRTSCAAGGRVYSSNAESKARVLGEKSSFLTNPAASFAPNSRSMPESSHSTDNGPL